MYYVSFEIRRILFIFCQLYPGLQSYIIQILKKFYPSFQSILPLSHVFLLIKWWNLFQFYLGDDTFDTVSIHPWPKANVLWKRRLPCNSYTNCSVFSSTLPDCTWHWWDQVLCLNIWSRSIWWFWWGWEETQRFFLQLVLFFSQCRCSHCFFLAGLDTRQCGLGMGLWHTSSDHGHCCSELLFRYTVV